MKIDNQNNKNVFLSSGSTLKLLITWDPWNISSTPPAITESTMVKTTRFKLILFLSFNFGITKDIKHAKQIIRFLSDRSFLSKLYFIKMKTEDLCENMRLLLHKNFFIEFFFISGANRYCLDKNYAGVLIIWDRSGSISF